jgi:hypothetical protein
MKITILLSAILISLTAAAQDFPGKRPALLLDKTVKVIPLDKTVLAYRQGYDNFYRDNYLSEPYAENKNRKTDHDALANRTLKVTAIEPYPLPGELNYKVQLQDTINNETIYYEYSELAEARDNYYFEVIGGLTYPPDFYCDYIEQENDESGTGQTFTTAIVEGLTITKIKRGKNAQYVMEVRSVQSIISMVKGITLVLESGHQVTKPDVQAEVLPSGNDNLVYVSTFELTPYEVSLLSQSKVVSGKVSKFDVTYAEGDKLQQMMQCMVKK